MGQVPLNPSCSTAECRRRLSYNSSTDTIQVDVNKCLPKHASAWSPKESRGPYEDILEDPLPIGTQECQDSGCTFGYRQAAAAAAIMQIVQELPPRCTADCMNSVGATFKTSSRDSAGCAECGDAELTNDSEEGTCRLPSKTKCSDENSTSVVACSERVADLTCISLSFEEEASNPGRRGNTIDQTGSKGSGDAENLACTETVQLSAIRQPPVSPELSKAKPRLLGCYCCSSKATKVAEPPRPHKVAQVATASHLSLPLEALRHPHLSPRQLEEHKRAVSAFLQENGFEGVDKPRRKGLVTATYPLHCAVAQGLVRMTDLLLEAGADVKQKNSWGQTPVDIARKCNKKGSHAGALQVLLQHESNSRTN